MVRSNAWIYEHYTYTEKSIIITFRNKCRLKERRRIYDIIDQLDYKQSMADMNAVGHIGTLDYEKKLIQITAHWIVPVPIYYNSIQDNGIAMITDDQLLRNVKDIRSFGLCNNGGSD